jgi:PBP superfamily domain
VVFAALALPAGAAAAISNQDDFAGLGPAVPQWHRRSGRHRCRTASGLLVRPGHRWRHCVHVPPHGGRAANQEPPVARQIIFDIFTGKITNWDSPEATHDYGKQLPSLPITLVIRSDGAGAMYFLTRWMAHLFPSQWSAFCERLHPGLHLPCP